MQDTALAFALRRERWLVILSLLAITALALGYTWWLATGFDMSDMMSPHFVPWTPGYFTFMLVMWIVMMIGMMTPSVAPTVLLYTEYVRRSAAQGHAFPAAGWFVAGYLLAWSAFATLATLLQWLLEWQVMDNADDGRHQPQGRWRHAGGRRRVPVAAVEAGLPGAMPFAAVVHPASRWFSIERAAGRCAWGGDTGSIASAAAGC